MKVRQAARAVYLKEILMPTAPMPTRVSRWYALPIAMLILLLQVAPQVAASSPPDGIFVDIGETSIARTPAARQIVPQAYRSLRLNRTALDALLSTVPMEATVPVRSSSSVLVLPLADGRVGRFRIVESPIMEPALAAKFPTIRTWLGQGIDDPTATLRFDVTPKGFHGQIIAADGSTYIDPYQPGDIEHYISYRKVDFDKEEPLVCGVTGETLPKDGLKLGKLDRSAKISSGANLRTYRLAVAATGEYTLFHGGTVGLGLAAIVTTINRVNGIYEREVAVRMVLVANNNLIVYTDAATDPYTNNDGVAMLTQNQNTLTTVIGSANYDFGHVVSTGGGGVAGLGVICNAGSKARGVTGSGAPIGDPFDVDYVAHEMGHQFGGNHTFNGVQGSCADNRNAGTAFEPGSGISIQAYAGICAPDNLAANSLDYFHRVSLNEIFAHTTSGSGSTCGNLTATGNSPPTVTTATAFNIPRQTPFELSASGNDTNGDALTYLWEQFDLGAPNAAGVMSDNGGPLFRNYPVSSSPRRAFPSWTYILNNANVPPATTGGFFTGELLPSSNRSMNFRVTARDNRAAGGGTSEASTTLTVNAAAGPFVVTSPNTAVSWAAASPQTVTWNVAGTSGAPINTATVRISLSLNGGLTWPLTLASGEPNDGSATLPALNGATPTTQARIRVSAENNIYFDVSDVNFTITGTGPTAPALSASTQLLTGNSLIEPNECNQLAVTLSNLGTATATAVSATLSTTTPNVTVSQPNAGFADIPAGQSRTSLTPFQISTGGALTCFSNINLSLTVTYSGGGSPYVYPFSLPVGQQGTGNYNFVSTSGATIAAGGALVAGSQADDAVVNLAVPPGFNFSVYGSTVSGGTTLRVSTNGNLQIVGSVGSSGWSNGALPNAGSSDSAGAFPAALPVLMPFWDDIDTSTGVVTGGGIYQQVTGSAPNRKWIVEWRGEQVNNPSSAISLKFAIEFNENSSVFAYVYELPSDGGSSATVGIQAATTGSIFTQYGFNSGGLSAGQRLTGTLSSSVCTSGAGGCGGGTPGVTVTESGGNTAVIEGGVSGDTYTMVLTSAPTADVLITPAPGVQLATTPSSLTFTTVNFATPQTVTVNAVDDRTVEGAHSGTITASAVGGGYSGVAIANVSAAIGDNDSASYQFTAASSSVGEAAGTATLSVSTTFTATGTGTIGLQAPITVPFTVGAGSTASGAGVDYTLAASSVSIPLAGTTQNIAVTINNDSIVEPAETLILDLGSETGGSVGQQAAVTLSAPASQTLTITDNDSATVTTANVAQNEGNSGTSNMPFVLQLAGQVQGGFTVNYQTRNDTATAGSDYVGATGSVSFDGTANGSRNILIGINGDTTQEATERFFLDLSTSAPGVQLTPASPSGDIVNDDFVDPLFSNGFEGP